MPKYKGKDVKVGDVVEVPAARVIDITEGHITAIPIVLPSNIVLDDEANPPKQEKPLKLPNIKFAPKAAAPVVTVVYTIPPPTPK